MVGIFQRWGDFRRRRSRMKDHLKKISHPWIRRSRQIGPGKKDTWYF